MDPGAIERLADRIRRSNAQEATITKDVADQRRRELDRQRELDQDRDLDCGFGID